MELDSSVQNAPKAGEKKRDNVTGRVKKILITFAACTLIAAAVSRAASTTRKRGRNSTFFSHLLKDCAHSLKNLIPTMDSVLAYIQDEDGHACDTAEDADHTSRRQRTGRSAGNAARTTSSTPLKRTRTEPNHSPRRRSKSVAVPLEAERGGRANTEDEVESDAEDGSSVSLPPSPVGGPHTAAEYPSSALGSISTGTYKLSIGDKIEIRIEETDVPVRATVTSDGEGETIATLDSTDKTIKLEPKHKATMLLDGTNYGSLRIQQALDKITETSDGAEEEVAVSVGDFVILAGENPASKDRESWMGVATSITKNKVPKPPPRRHRFRRRTPTTYITRVLSWRIYRS